MSRKKFIKLNFHFLCHKKTRISGLFSGWQLMPGASDPFPFVFGFGGGYGLPLHVGGVVWSAAGNSGNVIDYVIRAGSFSLSG
jgi:hypothetical protein